MKRTTKPTSNQDYGKNLTWGQRSITNSEVPFASIKSRILKAATSNKSRYSFTNSKLMDYISRLRHMPDARYYNGSGFLAAFAVMSTKNIVTSNWEEVRNDPEVLGTQVLRQFVFLLQEDAKQDLATERERSEKIIRQCALIYRYICFFMNNELRNQGQIIGEEAPLEEYYGEEEEEYFAEEYYENDADD